jgi:hypothetical protein
VGIGGLLAVWLAPRPPARVFVWDTPPEVRLCEEAPVSRARVEAALAWWTKLGARFVGVKEVGRCLFDADGAPLVRTKVAWRTITVTRATLETDAHTEWTAYAGLPLWSVVHLGLDDELVLAHELGHALGFPHVHRAGHVMNPSMSGLGWKVDGLAETLGGVVAEETDAR